MADPGAVSFATLPAVIRTRPVGYCSVILKICSASQKSAPQRMPLQKIRPRVILLTPTSSWMWISGLRKGDWIFVGFTTPIRIILPPLRNTIEKWPLKATFTLSSPSKGAGSMMRAHGCIAGKPDIFRKSLFNRMIVRAMTRIPHLRPNATWTCSHYSHQSLLTCIPQCGRRFK